jgi:hypothetical protein
MRRTVNGAASVLMSEASQSGPADPAARSWERTDLVDELRRVVK